MNWIQTWFELLPEWAAAGMVDGETLAGALAELCEMAERRQA